MFCKYQFIRLATEILDLCHHLAICFQEHAYRKRLDQVQIDDIILKNVEVDFNEFDYEDINGLLGLDLLMEAKFLIDLQHRRIYVQ